ncbi:MAG TPA: glycosyltransferase family 2 protein, partial [Blastocatellia bacterium]|nr:glycosyltransferase family 2 protein [Blastocatellia bacterium]
DNFQFGRHQTEHSYYFSRYPHVWGWATWRRAWQHYDVKISDWPEQKASGWLNQLLQDRAAVSFWQNAFQAIYDGQIDTWDHQWTYTCWRHNGLAALPSTNLISNIGFGVDATHTKRRSHFSNMMTKPLLFPLQHPTEVMRNVLADQYTQTHNFNSSLVGKARRLIKRFLPK